MPIYEYRSSRAQSCQTCTQGFEVFQKAGEPKLENCPECGAPVRRVLSAPNLQKPSPSLEPTNLEKHGFTQYKKSGEGVYEKTAGRGPKTIKKA